MNPSFAPSVNWHLIYDNLIVATVMSSQPLSYIPIAPLTLNYSLPYRFLRIAANNQNARSTWSYAGSLDLLVDEVDGARVMTQALAVNRAIIIQVPDYLERYRLRFTFPYWFDEISLQVDGYI